jgi:DNA topoisomerase VI subunit A
MARMTVAELKRLVAEMPDDLPVVVRSDGDEYEYMDALSVAVSTIDWTDEEDPDSGRAFKRTCLVIE